MHNEAKKKKTPTSLQDQGTDSQLGGILLSNKFT